MFSEVHELNFTIPEYISIDYQKYDFNPKNQLFLRTVRLF